MHLTNWKARRAGATITVTGTDRATGLPAKIVGVAVIEPLGVVEGPGCAAIDKDGVEHVLAA